MKKCAIIGKFAIGKGVLDGQTVKCSTIYEALISKYGKSEIEIIDTFNWKKHILKTLFKCFSCVKNSENIIMLPAQNGVKVFGKLLPFINKIYKRKLHYAVIGSWLYNILKENKSLCKSLKKFNAIYVETTLLRNNLEKLGFNNVFKMNNYKNIKVVDVNNFGKFKEKNILKTCIFSRINAEKGIEDAVNVLKRINNKDIKIELDIYGPVETQFRDKFNYILEENSEFVKYKGIIKADESVNAIKDYDLLLFPTRYKTEGIPGTIIDAFAAGVPVLASSWENYADMIENNVNGVVFEFKNIDDFEEKLYALFKNQKKLYYMKENVIKSAYEYCNIDALNILFKNMELTR